MGCFSRNVVPITDSSSSQKDFIKSLWPTLSLRAISLHFLLTYYIPYVHNFIIVGMDGISMHGIKMEDISDSAFKFIGMIF